MATITNQPHVLKDVLLTIGADDYQAACSSVRLVPTTNTPQVTFQGLTPSATFSEAGSPTTTWAFVITHAQDWETANSLSQFLFENAGQVKTCNLAPINGAGQEFTFDATMVPGEIGGDVNTVPVSPVTMPVDGWPIKSPWTP